MKKILLILSVFASLACADLFKPMPLSYNNSNEDVFEVAKNLPAGIKSEDLQYECKIAMQNKGMKADRSSVVGCVSIYKRYNLDPYPFIRNFVDKVMNVSKEEYALSPGKVQRLTCDDMLVGMNKGTLKTLFPKHDGKKLEDYALDYCIEHYSKEYFQ